MNAKLLRHLVLEVDATYQFAKMQLLDSLRMYVQAKEQEQ